MTEVYEISLDALATSRCFNPPNGSLTVRRFRFIDCHALVHEQLLRIIESEHHENVYYAAVSYPWRGNQAPPSQSSFHVPVQSDSNTGDPISIAVLRTACIAASHLGANFLWFDQVCIMQTSSEDKIWQIGRIADIYRGCRSTLVLPGGLQRLVGLDEETSWIYRAWTLQEAMPKSTFCIFSWRNRSCEVMGVTDGKIVEVEGKHSAIMDLGRLLQAAYVGHFSWGTSMHQHQCKVFGGNTDPILALMGVKELRDRDMREVAVWRSALMRTSSRAVDMVFSIMGIFEVSLDVRKYGKDDREKATMDLAYEILRTGRGATWLAASTGNANMSSMCTMPSFPATTVEGAAFYQIAGHRQNPWEVIGSHLDWALKRSPKGTIETRGTGHLKLAEKTISVKFYAPIVGQTAHWVGFPFVATVEINEGRELGRQIAADLSVRLSSHVSQTYRSCQAVVIGDIEQFQLPATAARASRRSTLIMLLSWKQNIWHKLGLAVVEGDFTQSWPVRTLRIGSSE